MGRHVFGFGRCADAKPEHDSGQLCGRWIDEFHCGRCYQFRSSRRWTWTGRKVSIVSIREESLETNQFTITTKTFPINHREFQRSFDGNDWGNNGPGVITRVLHTVCQTTYPPLMTRSRCDGFEVFDVPIFYAIPWLDWRHFFEPAHAEAVLQLTQSSYAVHVWNKHSYAERVRVGSRQAYGLLAAQYCPRVYAAAGKYFWNVAMIVDIGEHFKKGYFFKRRMACIMYRIWHFRKFVLEDEMRFPFVLYIFMWYLTVCNRNSCSYNVYFHGIEYSQINVVLCVCVLHSNTELLKKHRYVHYVVNMLPFGYLQRQNKTIIVFR